MTITGRGTVATGRVERGTAQASTIQLKSLVLQTSLSRQLYTGIEMFRKLLDFAEAGDNIGALLRGIQRNEIERGQVLCKPGSIHPHTKFKGQVYVSNRRKKADVILLSSHNYRPQFYLQNN